MLSLCEALLLISQQMAPNSLLAHTEIGIHCLRPVSGWHLTSGVHFYWYFFFIIVHFSYNVTLIRCIQNIDTSDTNNAILLGNLFFSMIFASSI